MLPGMELLTQRAEQAAIREWEQLVRGSADGGLNVGGLCDLLMQVPGDRLKGT